jgi:hypothetical protein
MQKNCDLDYHLIKNIFFLLILIGNCNKKIIRKIYWIDSLYAFND